MGNGNPSTTALSQWLMQISNWSDNNTGHAPITIILDAKDHIMGNIASEDDSPFLFNSISQGNYQMLNTSSVRNYYYLQLLIRLPLLLPRLLLVFIRLLTLLLDRIHDTISVEWSTSVPVCFFTWLTNGCPLVIALLIASIARCNFSTAFGSTWPDFTMFCSFWAESLQSRLMERSCFVTAWTGTAWPTTVPYCVTVSTAPYCCAVRVSVFTRNLYQAGL